MVNCGTEIGAFGDPGNAVTNTGKPLDRSTMTVDELLSILKLDGMDTAERAEFLATMAAWARVVIPGPNLWWRKAILTAITWRRYHSDRVDQLIDDALGTEDH